MKKLIKFLLISFIGFMILCVLALAFLPKKGDLTPEEKIKKEFTSKVDAHYKELRSAIESSDQSLINQQLDLFKHHNLTNYKDIKKILKNEEIKSLKKEIEKTPKGEYAKLSQLYSRLYVLDGGKEEHKKLKDQFFKKNKEAKIDRVLKSIDSLKDDEQLFAAYQSLSTLVPENKDYELKVQEYESKIKATQEKRKVDLERQKLINAHFSDWDGSHKIITEYVKKNMSDPDSFEHIDTIYWDLKSKLRVKMKFRGKNAFGGVVTQSILCEVTIDGSNLEVINLR